MKTFQINRNIEAVCQSENTRYGFRHLATLLYRGREVGSAKCCYYNRTWERYEFQSVLKSLAENAKDSLTTRQYNRFKKLIEKNFVIDNQKEIDKEFGTISAIASLGEIFGQTQKEKNDWKTRMIKAGLENKGLIIPEDWDSLSEDDKEVRLNKVITELKGGENL